MKTKFIIAALAGIIFMPFSYAEEKPKTHDVVVGAIGAYIPSGFDSHSDAFAVVNGLFPNSCYRIKEAKVDHIGAALHEVRTVAVVSDGLCLTVMVPFSKEVQLGKLQAGLHKIHFMSGDGTYLEKQLTIEE